MELSSVPEIKLYNPYVLFERAAGFIVDSVFEVDLDIPFFKKRNCTRFAEKDGVCWANPADSQMAITELNIAVQQGIEFIIFSKSSIWWLDYYFEFHQELITKYKPVLINQYWIVFDLKSKVF